MPTHSKSSRRAACVVTGLSATIAAVLVVSSHRPSTADPAASPARAAQTQAAAAKPNAAVRPKSALVDPVDVRTWTITYRAHDGAERHAYVNLPRWYGPGRNPQIPLVISPHGRGVDGRANSKLWGNTPAVGSFAVVNPDGQGSRLGRFSWGAPGQIADLARMPRIVEAALPWLRIDHRRIYALGGSMGGQETLLLVARYPRLLAGAVAVDALVDFSRQYGNFPRLRCSDACRRGWGGELGTVLQTLARRETGGSPATAAAAYAERSPLTYAAAIARSCVPLQIWWSRTDAIVVDSNLQSGRLAKLIRRHNPGAALDEVSGSWVHTSTMRARSDLSTMLAGLGLLPGGDARWVVSKTRAACSRSVT
jgi:dipeptidyl aminopeptidase/acylaminoacyl peptidase